MTSPAPIRTTDSPAAGPARLPRSVTFIVGSARSGTTALTQALALSQEATCLSEPTPNLNVESRARYEERLVDVPGVLRRDVGPRLTAADPTRHYIEKQVSLAPFVGELAELYGARFIVPVRNGRAVVASLLEWHRSMFPIIYRECRDAEALVGHAAEVEAQLVGDDPFDISLPRPDRDDPWHGAWPTFSRFEMVSWYWQYVNRTLLDRLEAIGSERFLLVDTTRPTVESVRRVYDFIGLTDFDAGAVAALLERRVNSVAERTGVDAGPRPEWTEAETQRFQDIAHETMHRLGFTRDPVRPRPPGFGEFWRDDEQDADWYRTIYEYRAPSHAQFRAWCDAVTPDAGGIESVMDLGCGIGVGYVEYFRDKRFVGVDLVPKAIEICRAERVSEAHEFVCVDPIVDPIGHRADLVMSHATVDNVYDIDAFLRVHARCANKLLYISNYRGWFGNMREHRYRWDPKMRVCFNDVSAARAEAVLRAEGFATVVVFPAQSGRDDIPVETIIAASRAPMDPDRLRAGHALGFDFAPYTAEPSTWTREGLEAVLDDGCRAYAADDRAGTLDDFRRVVQDLAAMPGRRPGPLADLAAGPTNLAVRVDVDMDLATARGMAAVANTAGLPMTFFLLHTASYYGAVSGRTFLRHEAMADAYRELQGAHTEVGLHTDALHLYLEAGIDGAQAIVAELDWLRSGGLAIRGTSAHNCAPVSGAENFEVFRGRVIVDRDPPHLVRRRTWVPLGTLDEAELGLTWEAGAARPAGGDAAEYLRGLPAGDFLRNPEWLRTYLVDNPYCRWGYDAHVWVLGRDRWAVGGHAADGTPWFSFDQSWTDIAARLAALDPAQRVCITLHPIYFGARA